MMVIQGRLSYRKAASKYNLKTSTLESRVKKFKDCSNTNRPSRTFQSKFTSLQVFSLDEEARLNDYIINYCKIHYGLTIVQIRRLAYEYAKSLNLKYPSKWDENQMAGSEWMRKYRERNANLSLRKPENTSAARSFAFNKTAVQDFYNNLADVFKRHNFAADRIFNFDESSVSTVLETPKILAPKSQKQVGQIVSAERGELVTFGAIISASGNTIPPLFIFPRVHYKDHFLDGAPEGSLGAAHRSGWINADIFVSVLKHILKHTLSSKEHPILLLCDNHESHISLLAITYARDNGIIFVSFPPHTSHRLQPLDVAVFGPFKAKLKIAFNNWHMSNPGRTINIYNIPKLIKFAYFESFTAKNITSGFEKPGIWPFNEMAFSDEDFVSIDVYATNNSENRPPNPETNMSVGQEPQPSTSVASIDMNDAEPITPEVISPYPTVRNRKANPKGRKPGKSRIYTDTPEKNEIEHRHRQKELKKMEQERKARAKEVKRNFKELYSCQKRKKTKKRERYEDSEESEESQLSLRDSSASPFDFEMDGETDDQNIDDILNVTPEKIRDYCYVLVKFAKKTSVVYYVGNVLTHYSATELKISYLRKKPGLSWSFYFPDIEDIHTLYISDVTMVLPDPQNRGGCTARMAGLFTFPVNLNNYNVQ